MNPIRKRKFDAFLSYSSKNGELAKKLFHWLNHNAGLKIWFDQEFFPPGTEIVKGLLNEIDQCRGIIVLATPEAAKSDHVVTEFEHARKTRAEEQNFSFVLLTPDVTEPPAEFKTGSSRYSCTGLTDDWLTLANASNILCSIANLSDRPGKVNHELFVSRSENRGEIEHADAVCREFAAADFGLVADIIAGGDWRQRTSDLMSEAHGHLVALPPQPLEEQQNFLDEIEMASTYGLPLFVCAHPEAGVPEELRNSPYFVSWDGKSEPDEVERAIQRFQRQLKPRTAPSEVFLACQYHERHERNDLIRGVIERVTSRNCRLGREHQVYRPELTSELVNQIQSARLVVADVASEVDEKGHAIVNLNTCIEAGIAMGANLPLIVLVRGTEDVSGKTDALPFMLRNCQVLYYEDDVELIGKLFHALAPFRRRLINP